MEHARNRFAWYRQNRENVGALPQCVHLWGSGAEEQLDRGQPTSRYVIASVLPQRKPEWDALRREVSYL